MSAAELFEGLAEAAEASAAAYRRRAAMLRQDAPSRRAGGSAVEAARRRYALGHRQVQVIGALEKVGIAGMTSAEVASAIGYEEPNTYNTLKGLVERGLVVKDTSVHPYRYRLGPELLAEGGEEDGEPDDR